MTSLDVCRKCGADDWATFPSQSGRRCRPCTSRRSREWLSAQTSEWRRERDLVRKYRLTLAEWESLFESQGRRCAICGTRSIGDARHKQWQTDHDHDSGRVRGILCHHCNIGLGNFRDDPGLLARAATYLEAR